MDAIHQHGFNFDLYKRNQYLNENGHAPPKATSTGTTIVGLIYKDGVVLGADTRATEGPIVADKNCRKIHYLTPQMYCCGAGTAADTEYVTDWMRSSLHLHSLNMDNKPARVITAMTMLKQKLFRYHGYIGAALILGGIDPVDGPQLYTIHPHGSTDKLPFVTMGSGSLAAMSIFESGYRPNMDEASAVSLVTRAIQAGIFNDLGSGSNVDVVVLNSNGAQILRNHVKPNERSKKERSYIYPRGTTIVINQDTEESIPMDISSQ